MHTQTQADTATREIVLSRVFDAPRELVFKTWSLPEHLDKWWGPEGFGNETLSMDFRVGGAWRYIMHSPEGVDYPNRMQYTAITEREYIAYDHTDDAPEPTLAFQGDATFSDVNGKTEITWRAIFASAEEREMHAVEYGAVEGAQQTLARLAEYIEELQ